MSFTAIITEKKPIRIWGKNIDEGAIKQAKNVANLPFLERHVALMPDAHQGYGVPIGCVFATRGIIIPNAVGVDIGCGVTAMRTGITSLSKQALQNIAEGVFKVIPMGFKQHSQPQANTFMPTGRVPHIVSENYLKALQQLGTLGGGNHFIELQKGNDGHIWVMIHSGSRNLGYTVARHFNELAEEKNAIWETIVDPKWELSYFPSEQPEGQDYIAHMKYCMQYASANRSVIMDRVKMQIRKVVGDTWFSNYIDTCHNHAELEQHYGQMVIVHRKGAISAHKDEVCIIPGSQGTASYIGQGKGFRSSWGSCSHGAGRLMSRTKAKKTLDFDVEKKKMDDLGIVHFMNDARDLDESSAAYKDIHEVMRVQEQLVEQDVCLKPILNMKG